MTDNTESMPEDVQETDTPEVDQPEQATEDQDNPNAEAAKYRRKLRDTETQRDQLSAQVEALQRSAIDQQVKAGGIAPTGFWAAGHQVVDMLDEDGNVDPTKIETGIKTAVDTLGLRMTKLPYSPKEGTVTNPRSTRSWEDAFKG